MRKLYDDVTKALAKIDFESIYPGFHPFTFALYNDESIYFADRVIPQQGFYGNTTVDFEGEHIAIWHVDRDTRSYDIDTFTAGIVHEMFHAFQRESGMESNAPNDLVLLQYPDDVRNHISRQTENELLAASVYADRAGKTALYHSVVASRNNRKANLSEFVNQEELIERWEGQAECCGTLALKQLATKKYEKRLEDYAGLLRKGEFLFDVRRSAYFSGTLMRLLEREVGDEICEVEKKLIETKKMHQRKFDEFFAHNTVKTSAEGYICGYDPMNQVRFGDQIFAKYFVAINCGGNPIQILGPVVVDMKAGSPNLTEAYYTIA